MPSYPPPPPPPPPQSYPPARPHSWVRPVAIYGAAGGAILIVGYGVYTALNNITTGGPGTVVKDCQAQWQQAFAAYQKQYQDYVTANGGAALTQQQVNALQPYVTTMQNAENCMVQAASVWSTSLTDAVLIVASIAGLYASFRAYLNYKQTRGGRPQFSSGAEARNAARQATTQQAVDRGEFSSAQGSGLVDQSNSLADGEATAEQTALRNVADAQITEAQASGDTTLVDETQSFVTQDVDIIDADVLDSTEYWLATLGL